MPALVPPRRQIPPPPPPRAAPASTEASETEPLGLAARIAKFQLNPALPPPYPGSGRKSVDDGHGRSSAVVIKTPSKAFALVLAGLDPDYLSRLLARAPPPVPGKQYQELGYDPPPQLPPRRLPPRPPSPPQPDYDPTPDEDPNGAPVPETYHYHTQEEGGALYHEHDHDDSTGGETDFSPGSLFRMGTCIKCHDFSAVDTHAALFPRQNVRSLDDLAHNLTEPFIYETEKARAIFTWMHHNIQYDAQSFFAGNLKPATPGSTLSSGLAVCDGYAGLFVDLAERVGLQVLKVSGHGKGFGYKELAPGEPLPKMTTGHAWNCVLMDGEWRLIDATWGAGALNGSTYEQRFDPSWFSSTPTEFARRHFPTDPTYQLIADEHGGPITWEDYILCPEGPIIFNDFHRLDFLVDLLQPALAVVKYGQVAMFVLFKRCEHMSNLDADNYVYILAAPGRDPIPLEPNAEGGWSLDHRIYDQTEVSLMFVATVDGQDAKGIGIRALKNALGRKPMTFGGLAKWTVV